MTFPGNPPAQSEPVIRLAIAGFMASCLLAISALQLAAAEQPPIFDVELEDHNGEELLVGELLEEGVVLFDFWATWCKPCQHALVEKQKLYEKFRDRGLTVIAISVDGPRNYSKIRPFISRMGLTFPIVIDTSGEYQRSFKVTAIPTSILLDSSGETIKVRQGYRPGEVDAYFELLDDLLPPAPTDSLETRPKADTTGTSRSSSR